MKIAVITGASSGMGREMARILAEKIPNIREFWLIGRREERLTALAAELSKPSRILPLNLASEADLARYEETLEREKPEIVFLVNAAGFGKLGKVQEGKPETLSGMVDVNVRALTVVTRFSLPFMAEKSRIINFASSAAFLPQPNFSVYAASKAYVLSFSRALHQELKGSGCHVTAVCPGPVKTEFFDIAEETGEIPFYKYLVMADPQKVVRLALTDSVLGKDISVYGVSMKLLRLLRKLPTGFLLRGMALLNRVAKKDV